MKLQSRRREDVELNLTSLIDVVLLLVIFFMVSTTFVQEGRLRVELPRTAKQPAALRGEPLVITGKGLRTSRWASMLMQPIRCLG